MLESHDGPLIVPVLVVTEVGYLLETRMGYRAEVPFLGDLASGALRPEHVHESDWMRMAELVARYTDLPLGSVDASVVAAAERLSIGTIATLDHKHFGLVRPRHRRRFDLVP